MTAEGRKLQLIAAIINENDEAVLTKLERVFKFEQLLLANKKTLFDFESILTKEEARAMWKSVEECEGCGHPDCLYKTFH